MKAHSHLLAVCSVLVAARRLSVCLADTIEVAESSRQFEFELIRKNNDNIKHCGLCSTGASRIETAKYNTHDKRNIIMTDDLHVPVISAEL